MLCMSILVSFGDLAHFWWCLERGHCTRPLITEVNGRLTGPDYLAACCREVNGCLTSLDCGLCARGVWSLYPPAASCVALCLSVVRSRAWWRVHALCCVYVFIVSFLELINSIARIKNGKNNNTFYFNTVCDFLLVIDALAFDYHGYG